VTPPWDTDLPPAVRERLTRLNEPRYMAHMAHQLEDHRAFAQHAPRRWDVVEIGSNRGTFCLGLAEAHPDWTVLALELRGKWVARLRALAAAEGHHGLFCHRADARLALPILAPAASVESLFVLYPDPWWKRRHEHRRLLDGPFFEVAAELLAPDGLLAIKTDVRRVYDDVLELSRCAPDLRLLGPWEWPDERAWPFSTRERTCLRTGMATYRLFWRRAGATLPETAEE
jgi:tRNA (guanine-N7-)-methyltransferase